MFTSGAQMQPDSPPANGTARAQSLAETLDCLTEEDLCVLYNIQPSTAENWRKRGKGPSYILAGNRYLYPRANVAADLQARLRTRCVPSSKNAL